MRQTVLVSAIVICLLIGAQSTYAQHSSHPQTDFKSGYDHGVADASDPCKDPKIPCLAYVWKSPNGFINQTDDFIDGYVVGFCKIAGVNASTDEPEAGFYCSDGPKSANWDIGQTINGHYTSKFPSRNLPSH